MSNRCQVCLFPRISTHFLAAKSVRFDGEMMDVSLTDGRIVSVPIIWFPLLQKAIFRNGKLRDSMAAASACTGRKSTKISPSPGCSTVPIGS